MRQAIWILVSTFLVEFIIAPIGGRVFNHFVPQDAEIRTMIPDIAFYHWGYATLFALGAVVGIAVYRWRIRREKIESNFPTSVQIQFKKGSHNANQIRSENVRFWFANRQSALLKGSGIEELERISGEYACWQIFLIFGKPTVFDQIFVDAHGAEIPSHALKAHCAWGVVLEFQGDMGGALVDIRFGKANPV